MNDFKIGHMVEHELTKEIGRIMSVDEYSCVVEFSGLSRIVLNRNIKIKITKNEHTSRQKTGSNRPI